MARNSLSLERLDSQGLDSFFAVFCVVMALTGLAVLFSASYHYSELRFHDAFYMVKKQAIYLIVGLFLAWVVLRVPVELMDRYMSIVMVVTLVLLLLPFVPGIGRPINGAHRWIIIAGNSFQPSEFSKIVLVFYLAGQFAKKQDRLDEPMSSVLPPMIVTILFVVIVYLQNDFSTAAFLFILSMLMFFFGRVRLRYFAGMGLVSLTSFGLLLFAKEYRLQRFLTWNDPTVDPNGSGFQILAILDSLKNGGFLGKGFGYGMKKLGGLPEAHSDFIMAVIGEEAGLVGILVILLLFVLFALKGYRIALAQKTPYLTILGLGLTSIIFLQAVLNAGIVSQIIPTAGINMPFFSSGGSNLLMTLVACGFLVNLSRNTERSR